MGPVVASVTVTYCAHTSVSISVQVAQHVCMTRLRKSENIWKHLFSLTKSSARRIFLMVNFFLRCSPSECILSRTRRCVNCDNRKSVFHHTVVARYNNIAINLTKLMRKNIYNLYSSRQRDDSSLSTRLAINFRWINTRSFRLTGCLWICRIT